VRSHWGWGFEAEQPSLQQRRVAAAGLAEHLGFGSPDIEEPVQLAAVSLPAPRVEVPAALAGLCSQDTAERVRHAHGRSYLDVVRGLRGRFPHPPDAVARPGDEAELARVLEWCAGERLAVVPYGGGTSVVGGVDAIPGLGHAGAVSLDLGRMDRVLEVDAVSRAARIQAGARGPRLEEQLGELTMRFYPQSFELSTLGGWIATRAAGHFATGPTHVDDLVESVRGAHRRR
jgi:alkyldihydroxyacetonephosphate synthase